MTVNYKRLEYGRSNLFAYRIQNTRDEGLK